MTTDSLHKKNTKTLVTVLLVVVGMIILSFASVSLYKIFCQTTGFGGATIRAESSDNVVVLDRMMTVRFNADTAQKLDWEFKPKQKSVDVKIGEENVISYMAKNLGTKPIAGTAVFNVTPLKAGKYFNKVACFCFDEQILQPGEEVDMPVSFFVDPSIADDKNMDDVKTITLSYTFFATESDELDQAMEVFYNTPDE